MLSPMLYLNGSIMPLADGRVSVEDRGFQLGDGVYEVLKIDNGRLLWLEDHLERLDWSTGQVLLSGALDGHPLAEILPRLVSMSGLRQGTAYVQVTRGAAPREFALPSGVEPTVLAYVRPHEFPSDDEVCAGIAVHAVEDLRWARCDIKSTNLLPAVLAKHAAGEAGAREALYVSADGVVREGGSSNAFVVLDGTLRTHPANNRILNGITRCHVLDLARELGFPVLEQAVHVSDLPRASEIFIASTIRDVMPVVRVGGLDTGMLTPRGGVPGEMTIALAEAMRSLIARCVGVPAPPRRFPDASKGNSTP
ncbi:MAG TPA: aminotransferase class IV [Thermoleophilia bacterium]|nr:aminotransferase class IV [Thermoleophilia bacterium]